LPLVFERVGSELVASSSPPPRPNCASRLSVAAQSVSAIAASVNSRSFPIDA
jgi:hypothetical protein